MDKVSIVVPVYNTKKEYLDECIYSALNQDYKNIEVLIIDDGSKEDTAKLCDAYMKVDSRVKVIHKENEGVSVARNIGIEEATGDWVFFLDSDDWIEKDSFANIYEYEKYDIVAFKQIFLKGSKNTISDIEYNKVTYIEKKSDFEKVIKKMLINNDLTSTMGMTTSKLYRIDFLKQYNIRFKKEIVFREDTIFNISAFKNAKKMEFVNKLVYNYRINDFSVTQTKDTKYIKNNEKLIRTCKEVLDGEYLDEYYAFVIWQLNYMFIKNVFCDNISNKCILVKEILKYEEYQNAIKNVKLKLLSKRKQLLVLLLRSRCHFLLKFLYSI